MKIFSVQPCGSVVAVSQGRRNFGPLHLCDITAVIVEGPQRYKLMGN